MDRNTTKVGSNSHVQSFAGSLASSVGSSRINAHLLNLLKDEPSVFLVSSHSNIYYLTGFKGLAENEREAWVVITPKDTSENADTSRPHKLNYTIHLITDGRYFEKIENRTDIIPHCLSHDRPLSSIIHGIILGTGPSDKKISTLSKKADRQIADTDKPAGKSHFEGKITGAASEPASGPIIFFESDDVTFSEYEQLSEKLQIPLKPTRGIIADLRTIKNTEEIAAIIRACRVTDECFAELRSFVKIGMTEYEIARFIESWLSDRGFGMAFYPIIAVDKNAAVPHYDTRNEGRAVVNDGSVILVDFGAKVDGYCADMTRMIAIGNVSDEFVQAYNVVLKAQEGAIRELGGADSKNGRSISPQADPPQYKAVEEAARYIITDAGYPTFEHATGHGLGLDIHEAPRISGHATEHVKPGHVVTIEPGIYLPGKFGIRIEDTVLIDESGMPKVLTLSEKSLKSISIV